MADFALGQQTPTVVRCMRKAEVGAGWQVYRQLCPAGVCLSCSQRQRLAAHRGWSSTPAAAEDCRLWTAADLHPTSRPGHTGGGPAVRSPPWQVDPPRCCLHNSLRIISPLPASIHHPASKELVVLVKNSFSAVPSTVPY